MPENWYAQHAQELYAILKSGKVSCLGKENEEVDDLLSHMQSFLFAGGLDAAALDPTGKKSRVAMEKELAIYAQRGYLKEARELFTFMESDKSTLGMADPFQLNDPFLIDEMVAGMDEFLAQAHQTYAALDPKGKASADTMQKRFSAAVIRTKNERAPLAYAQLQTGESKQVEDLLYIIGQADITALDPTGKKSRVELTTELDKATKNAYVALARSTLSDIARYKQDNGISATPADDGVYWMRYYLEQAGADVTALDPTGKKNAVQMEEAIAAAVRSNHFHQAQEQWDYLKAEKTGDVDRNVSALHDELRLAGVTAAALDPTGHASESEMENQINAAAKTAHIAAACSRFSDLMRGVHLTPDQSGLIHHELAEAGVDASALDPDHKKSAAEMEAIITERLHDFDLSAPLKKPPVDGPAIKQQR